ncbi:cell shape-determining protein MreC [Paenibacillus nasutitermitis]|uniref:Cell shape-determining protein MreC n=2 Tax=Paenibacillus nasutitermitis TaxID=1652958 RepID=A0A916YP65_9BACL|nr:cell shape-determining protein MreC [Paenibacillus nasutitermitis]
MFVLMIGFIVFVAVMGFSIGDRKKLTWPENFVLDSSAFVQQWFYRPAGYIAGLFEDLANLRDVYRENEILRVNAANYARDSVKFNIIKEQNESLKEDLGFTERQKGLYEYEYIIAQVVSASNDPYDQTIRIDLGSKDGIELNMVVITTKGLVGLISRVDPFYSSVMPITDLDANSLDASTKQIPATAENKKKSFGMIESYRKDTGKLVMSKIPENDPIAKGDTVITSGLANVFPRGLIVGTVDSVQVGDFGLTNTATITPAADFNHLTEVFVVKVPNPGEETK